MKRYEHVDVPFEDETELEQTGGTLGMPVDIYDQGLQTEEIEVDLEADAFATFAVLEVKTEERMTYISILP
jgi:hypothetical protein